MPSISVIIPTYAHARFVQATIDSVLAQTFRDVEIIVINDGSPDTTAAVLQPLADAGTIRYVEQPNGGQASARNHGLLLATGEFVAFLDDDDLWPADKLQRQVRQLQSLPTVGAVYGAAMLIDADGVPGEIAEVPAELTFESLLVRNPILSPGQTLIRRTVLSQVGGLDASIWGTDDWDLWLKIASQSQLAMTDGVTLLYRRHASNATHQLHRMVRGASQTLARHLPSIDASRRTAVRQASFANLHAGWGRRLADQMKHDFRHSNFKSAWRNLKTLIELWRGLKPGRCWLRAIRQALAPARVPRRVTP